MEPHSRPCSSQNGTLRFPQALILLLSSCLARSPTDQVVHTDPELACWHNIKHTACHLILRVNPFVDLGSSTTSTFVGMVKLAALCGIGSALWIWRQRSNRKNVASNDSSQPTSEALDDAAATDPGLLKKHSSVRSFAVPAIGITYPGIRTFYRPHPQSSKLPSEPKPVPLLVFIHGLGGSAAQFHPILVSLSNLATCLAIDLPGCGLSTFSPTNWEAYTTDALVQLLAVVIEAHRDRDAHQDVILIGHSMGCSLAALLASAASPYSSLISEHVTGLISICPKADPPDEKQQKMLKALTSIPAPLFNLSRKWDRRGGINSASVVRMTGLDAEEETKKLQLRFNRQSRTEVWQRMAYGMIPDSTTGSPKGGIPGQEVWSGICIPLFLAAGEADHITPTENVRRIVEFLGRDASAIGPPSEKTSLPIATAPIDPALIDPEIKVRQHQDSGIDANDLPKLQDDATRSISSSANNESSINTEGGMTDESTTVTENGLGASTTTAVPNSPTPRPRRLVVKTAIMPKPAAHSLLFAPSSSRILSGLIGDFVADHIDPRLSLAWQLQYLSTEGKWDVKNLEKWKAVEPVSLPIADTFRAMKTLREVDEKHSPKIFAKEWAGKLCAVIDISHDAPVYDPKGLEDGGIPYYKFPTVSKQPPSPDEVKAFIELVDKVRSDKKEGLVGVHCHYGYNRTGFFLVCYLIERLGYRVEEAIDTFQKARPLGIRHAHFIDTLHVRYCTGLKKAPTL